MRCAAGMRVCVTELWYYGMEYERIGDRTPCTGHSYGVKCLIVTNEMCRIF